jgi:hypothetical protein
MSFLKQLVLLSILALGFASCLLQEFGHFYEKMNLPGFLISPPLNSIAAHHAEGLVNPKEKVTDFGYPRACRFRKHQIENRFTELALPTFFKTWFKKNSLTDFQTFSAIFTLFRLWNTLDSFEQIQTFSKKSNHILWTKKITFWKKLVEQAPGTCFQFDIFWIYMLWGIQNE